MSRRKWFETLQTELLSRKLPVNYIREFLQELAEHFDDLVQEEGISTMSTDTLEQSAINRLGSPRLLAETAQHNHSYSTLSGRYPWLTFVLAPVPLFALCVAAYAFLIIAIGSLAKMMVGREGTAAVINSLWFSMNYIPAAAATMWVYRCWRKSDRSWQWLVPAVLCLCVVAGMLMASFTHSPVPGESQASIGFMMSYVQIHSMSHSVTPLLVTAALCLLNRSRKPLLNPA